ncbi:MAG TPA: enediyne biosynthesis protein, partial [Actinophytocola sp.]|nr:enediyne biosynthesis protein [Actinophytocola sp.]
FGAGIATTYGLLTGAGIAYGLFFATATICLIRGGYHWTLHITNKTRTQTQAAPAPAATGDEPGPAQIRLAA